jgi:hypothetical protein
MSQLDMRAESAEVRPSTGSGPVPLEEFNRLSTEAANRLLRPCLDIDRWVRTLVDHRPYAQMDELIETARQAANPFTDEEVVDVLAHHPRIAIIADQLRGIPLLRLARVVAP